TAEGPYPSMFWGKHVSPPPTHSPLLTKPGGMGGDSPPSRVRAALRSPPQVVGQVIDRPGPPACPGEAAVAIAIEARRSSACHQWLVEIRGRVATSSLISRRFSVTIRPLLQGPTVTDQRLCRQSRHGCGLYGLSGPGRPLYGSRRRREGPGR